MILVTVGTEQYSFDRLMTWITLLIKHQLIQEEVIVQYGACQTIPANVTAYKAVPSDRFAAMIREARLVISHCGEGSLLMLEEIGTPYILVPRSVRFNEHVDDHQVELAIALATVGVQIAWSPGELAQYVTAQGREMAKVLPIPSTQALCYQLSADFQQVSSNRVRRRFSKSVA
jgi:UDP-N-acetylglucosamine transferase subunit ALG13